MTKEAIEKLPEVMQSMTATLKHCSKDDASFDYMTESRLLAVNFDRFSKYYCQVVKIAQQPKTNDALYCTEDGKWYFVEFKNGSIKKDEIYRKIYDSLIMLIEAGMIPDYQFSRENISYILVYNKEKIMQEKQIKVNSAKNQIHRHIEQKQEKLFCLFELEKLQGYILDETNTYTKEQFEQLFVKKFEKVVDIYAREWYYSRAGCENSW